MKKFLWNLVFWGIFIIVGLGLLYYFSEKIAALFSALWLGGGAAVKRKVRKRAELKAKDVPDTDPHAVIDDINKRIR